MGRRLSAGLDHLATYVSRFPDRATWDALRSLGPTLIDQPSALDTLDPPADVIAAWYTDARQVRAHHVVQADAFAELERAWWRSGVAVLIFKGFDTATRFYPDPSRRAMDDIDILVRPADVAAAASVAIERGFTRLIREPGRLGPVDDDVHAEWTLRRAFGRFSIEIDCHWRPIADHRLAILLPGIEEIDLWDGAAPIAPEGALRPSAPRAALHCAISQIVGHPWSHPLGYLDLYLLGDDETWPTTLTLARRAGLLSSLALAARFARALYGAPGPPSIDAPWAVRTMVGDDWLGRNAWRRQMFARDVLLIALSRPRRLATLIRSESARLARRRNPGGDSRDRASATAALGPS